MARGLGHHDRPSSRCVYRLLIRLQDGRGRSDRGRDYAAREVSSGQVDWIWHAPGGCPAGCTAHALAQLSSHGVPMGLGSLAAAAAAAAPARTCVTVCPAHRPLPTFGREAAGTTANGSGKGSATATALGMYYMPSGLPSQCAVVSLLCCPDHDRRRNPGCLCTQGRAEPQPEPQPQPG